MDKTFYSIAWVVAAAVCACYGLRGPFGIVTYVFAVILAVRLAQCFERKLWSSIVMLIGVILPFLAFVLVEEFF